MSLNPAIGDALVHVWTETHEEEVLRSLVRLSLTNSVLNISVEETFRDLFGERSKLAFAIVRACAILEKKGIKIDSGVRKLSLERDNRVYGEEFALLLQHETLIEKFLYSDERINYVFHSHPFAFKDLLTKADSNVKYSLFTSLVLLILTYADYYYEPKTEADCYLPHNYLLQKYNTLISDDTYGPQLMCEGALIFPAPEGRENKSYIGDNPESDPRGVAQSAGTKSKTTKMWEKFRDNISKALEEVVLRNSSKGSKGPKDP